MKTKDKTFEVILDPPFPGQGTSYISITVSRESDEESLKWFCETIRDRVHAVYDLDDVFLEIYFPGMKFGTVPQSE